MITNIILTTPIEHRQLDDFFVDLLRSSHLSHVFDYLPIDLIQLLESHRDGTLTTTELEDRIAELSKYEADLRKQASHDDSLDDLHHFWRALAAYCRDKGDVIQELDPAQTILNAFVSHAAGAALQSHEHAFELEQHRIRIVIQWGELLDKYLSK